MKHLFLLILLLGIIFLCCEKDTGPLNNTQVNLTAEYVGVTEVDIKLRVDPPENGLSFQLFRNDSLIRHGALTSTDTLILDSTLSPAQTYRYSAKVSKGHEFMASSQKISVTTKDTTSHDFVWEVIPFGNPLNSTLLDVSIIDENNIWAVGEIYADSGRFNAISWNGDNWNMHRILTRSVMGNAYSLIMTIFHFDPGEIWTFSDVGSYSKWNGSSWSSQFISARRGGIRKIWGEESNNIFFVGTNGNITHYFENEWTQLESGTNEPFNDIFGVKNSINEIQEYLCAVGDIYGSPFGEIISIKPDLVVDKFPWVKKAVHSVWAKDNRRIYACGDGIWSYKENKWSEFKNVPGAFRRSIRGNSDNDIFVCGDYGYISHFNGLNWKSWQWPNISVFQSIDVKENIVVAVGVRGQIVIGKRNL